ncbi:MAG: terminase large subunit [Paludibaculum sp.]
MTGDFAGQPFWLMPWIRDVLRDIFGTLDEDGMRRYRECYLEVPKKNTKTTVCAGIVVFCVATAPISGTEVYSAATSKEQAGIVFRAAAQMALNSPVLRRRLKVVPSAKRIFRRDDPTSFYAALSADGDVNDGINPSVVIKDELHRWRTRKAMELNEILSRGGITRQESLEINISTAGEEGESPLCWRQHEYTRLLNDGTITDRRFYGRIWAADLSKHDWASREARVQANPSHEDNGGYLKDEILAALCLKAQNDPQAKADYLRYHLNVWGQRSESVINLERWSECGGGIDLRTWPEYDPELLVKEWGLANRPCVAGVDMSWSTDLTSTAFVFPPMAANEVWSFLLFFWMADERVRFLERNDKVPYSSWVRKGFIETVPGAAISDALIKRRLEWGRDRFEVRNVAYDPWGFRAAAEDLTKQGFACVEVRQGYASLSEPTKKLLELYQTQGLRHGNNPVLNWNARCLALLSDNKDNVQPAKPERAKSSKRIDGIAASINGMVLGINMAPKKRGPGIALL